MIISDLEVGANLSQRRTEINVFGNFIVRIMNRCNELILVLFLTSNVVFGQNDSTFNPIWGGVGLNVTDIGIGYQGNFTLAKNRNVFNGTFYESAEFLEGFMGSPKTLNTTSSITNLSLMCGHTFKNNSFTIAPMTGLSFGKGSWRNSTVDTIHNHTGLFANDKYIYHYNTFYYIGVPLNLSIIWTPSKYLGLSTTIYYNMHRYPDYGIAISIIGGVLKKETKNRLAQTIYP